jgi:hypothetical protein
MPAVQRRRVAAQHFLPLDLLRAWSAPARGGDSQNLRRISRLWIKLEQLSQVCRKSLTALMKIALQTC